MDGIELLIRYEVDACHPEEKPQKKAADLTDLLAGLDRVRISATTTAGGATETATTGATGPPPAAPKPPAVAGVEIVPSGTLVAQSRTIELVTCSRKFINTFSWGENYPQLFLSQTAHHFLGLHDFGTFSKIEKRTLESLAKGRVGEEQQGDLKKLGKILRTIYDRVVEKGDGVSLSLVCVGGTLSLRSRTDKKRALPMEVLEMFRA